VFTSFARVGQLRKVTPHRRYAYSALKADRPVINSAGAILGYRERGARSTPPPGRIRRRTQQQYLFLRELMTSEDAEVLAPAHSALLDGSADTSYLSSQTSSMRQPLVMLLTMIENPFT
jgi:hypothetical protein